jgi:hypothetical protein
VRARSIATVAVWTLAAVACAHEERRPPNGPSGERESAPVHAPTLPQYVLADSFPKQGAVVVPLGRPGVRGVVVDKRRVVVGQGEPRVAPDATPETIIGATRLAGRFGGGFLFWTAHTLYRAESFDGKLTPLARVPEPIDTVAYGPKSILVRTHNGERWALRLPSGERAPIAPLGVADIGALDDGRAVALSEQGAVFTSSDHGSHWVDATAQLKTAPTKVEISGGDVWLVESSGDALRLEPDGRLARFDKLPVDESEVRPKDPRWRGTDSPLRSVFRGGAAIDDNTAIVIDSGDVVRVDVHTGEIQSVVPGHLPPDAHCEAVPVPGDVLFCCIPTRSGGGALVVSHTLGDGAPTVEQTFTPGGQFFASDDGGLAYAGSCQGVPPGPGNVPSACVRTANGAWEERDLSGFATDGGASDIGVARWIPRADGRVVAIVVEPAFGIYDPQLARFQPIAEEAREIAGHGMTFSYPSVVGKHARARPKRVPGGGVVDASWSFGSNSALVGWQRNGESIEISEDGRVKRSPFAFEVAFAGATGLGRSKDGRLYQSFDHGVSWSEVAVPPSGEALELASCTTAGCDLGAFYRVGWAQRQPLPETPKVATPPAPEVGRTRSLELSCRPQGAVVNKLLPRTSDSPEDLGLGASRLPIASESSNWAYIRNPSERSILNPGFAGNGNDSEVVPSLRLLLSGFGTSRDGDVISVTGPNKNALALRRAVSYVPPFDPLGRIVRTGIAMSEVVTAGRRAGLTTDEILAEDFTEGGVPVPLTSVDPAAPSDIAIHGTDHGLLTFLHGERVRVGLRPSQDNANVISGVVLGNGDEAAFLEVESTTAMHVFKLGPAGITELFDIKEAPNELHSANPDALAIGPKGELAILRTPSGSDPASGLDPAMLIVPSMPPQALAPWSELKLADDPTCKAEPGGYRATVQLIGPWIRLANPELRVEDGPMIARVRWTPKRVCLEGFEVKLPGVSQRVPRAGGFDPVTLGTWLVGKGSTFARVAVTEGAEWRQPLECSIVSKP